MEHLRERGERRAAAFSWQRAADETVEVYERAMGRPARSLRAKPSSEQASARSQA
jgi:hypothetical protein